MKKYIIILITLHTIGCDPYDNRLKIINNTKDTIFYSTSNSDSLDKISPIKRDSVTKNILRDYTYMILPDSNIKESFLGKNGWEYFINTKCKDSAIRIFLFEKRLILNTPWDSIVLHQRYSKKYKLTVKHLQKLNWQVAYP